MVDQTRSQVCRRLILAAILFFCIWSGPGATFAGELENGPLSGLGVSAGAPRFGDTRDFVHVVSVRRPNAGNDELVVTLRIDRGFHVNANPASLDYLLATSLAFVGVEPEKIIYPSPLRFKPKFVDEPIDVYEGTIAIRALFSKGTLDRIADLRGSVAA